MRRSLLTIITFVLLLAMLAVPMTAVVSADEVDAGDSAAINISDVDEWKFADNYYQADWTTGKLNTTGTQLLKADDSKDIISWNSTSAFSSTNPDAAVDLTDGVLTFSGASRWQWVTRFKPGQMTTDKLEIGPTMIGLDYYIPRTSSGGYFEFYFGDAKLFHVNQQYGQVYCGNTWTDFEGSWIQQIGRTEGWYTFEFILIPQTEDGTICTTAEQTVAKNTLYMRVTAASDTIASAPTAITTAELSTWYSVDLPTAQVDHYVNLEGGVYFGSSNTNTVKIRRAKSSNLIPLNKMTASFEGFDSLKASTEPNTAFTLPAADGVVAWVLDGKYYLPGTEYTLTSDVTFTPLMDTVWNTAMGYDSSALWNNTTITEQSWGTFHSGDGYSPVVQWTKNSSGSASYTYNGTDKSVTIQANYISDTDKGGNNFDWYLGKSAPVGGVYADKRGLAYSFEIFYDPDTFCGTEVKIAWSTSVLKATTAGVVTSGGKTLGNLVEGWNTIQFYYVANSDNTVWTVYTALNAPEIPFSVSPASLITMPHVSWTYGTIATGDTSPRMQIYILTAAAADAPTSITCRNFKSYNMIQAKINYVDFSGAADMMTYTPGTTISLPTPEGVAFWTDGTSFYVPGAKYTPTTAFAVLSPASEEQMAYKTLGEAVSTLEAAFGDRIVPALNALVEAMANPALDPTDERYITAANLKAATVATLEGNLTDYLTGLDAKTAPARYAALINAIKIYQSIKDFIDPAVTATLANAIADYNAFADSMNADAEETVTVAVIATIEKLPNTQMVAILADIKSKVEE